MLGLRFISSAFLKYTPLYYTALLSHSHTMRLMRIAFIAFTLLLSRIFAQVKLNVTAITAHGRHSTLECWEISSPFAISHHPSMVGGMIASLGDISNASWTVLPSGFDNGLHNAPYNQSVSSVPIPTS